MPDRSRKRPSDLNQRARAIVQILTGETEETPAPRHADDGKDPAAVSLGRRGGLKGGKARAEALSAKRRRQIAREAARARWSKPQE